MKEWQRWEAMAVDFASVGDHRREAECLDMALDLLPPGHWEDKGRLAEGVERARARAVETGDEATLSVDGPGDLTEDLVEELEAMGPGDARRSVLAAVRGMATTVDGASEDAVLETVVTSSGLEEDLVREALEELVDEGVVYRGRPGRLMMDGVVDGSDLETAVLGVVGELSTEGRGAARHDVVSILEERGFPGGEVEEALDDLVEAGRFDEDGVHQLRSALAILDIQEVHHQVYAALEEMDEEGRGVLDARLERDLVSRGLELVEVRQALVDLVDEGDVVRDGGEVRLAGPPGGQRESRELMLEVVHALSEDKGRPVPMMTVLRAARSRGLAATRARRTLDDLVDTGRLWKDDRGVHLTGEGETDPGKVREALLAAVRQLAHAHDMGAPRVEVLDMAVSKGLGETEARETLEELLDDGLVHDAGGGFLRPG